MWLVTTEVRSQDQEDTRNGQYSLHHTQYSPWSDFHFGRIGFHLAVVQATPTFSSCTLDEEGCYSLLRCLELIATRFSSCTSRIPSGSDRGKPRQRYWLHRSPPQTSDAEVRLTKYLSTWTASTSGVSYHAASAVEE